MLTVHTVACDIVKYRGGGGGGGGELGGKGLLLATKMDEKRVHNK